jgi:hypothetical protein
MKKNNLGSIFLGIIIGASIATIAAFSWIKTDLGKTIKYSWLGISSSSVTSSTNSSPAIMSSSSAEVSKVAMYTNVEIPGFGFKYDTSKLTLDDSGIKNTVRGVRLSDTKTLALDMIGGSGKLLTIRLIKNPDGLGGGEPCIKNNDFVKLQNGWSRVDLTNNQAPSGKFSTVDRNYYQGVDPVNTEYCKTFKFEPYLFDTNGYWYTVTTKTRLEEVGYFDDVVSSITFIPKK